MSTLEPGEQTYFIDERQHGEVLVGPIPDRILTNVKVLLPEGLSIYSHEGIAIVENGYLTFKQTEYPYFIIRSPNFWEIVWNKMQNCWEACFSREFTLTTGGPLSE